MFKKISMEERLQQAEAENRSLKAQLTQTVAQTAYIAMMSDVELPTTSTTAQGISTEGSGEDE